MTTIAAPIGVRRQPSISSRTSRKSAAAIAAETIARARLAKRCGRPVRRSSVCEIPVAASCLATARIGTAAASAIGTWIRKIDCQETSSVRRPPTAGPSAAPVAPALAQIAAARRSEPTVAGSSSSAAVTAAAPPSACTQRASDQGRELVGEPAGEAGAGEDRQPDGGGAPRSDPTRQQRRRHRGQRHHQVEGDQHPGDAGDAGVELAVDLRQRQDDDRGVGEDEADGERQGGDAGPRGLGVTVAQLLRVLIAVLVTFLEHLFDVGARFREGDLARRSDRSAPLVGVAGPGVVGGQRRGHVAVVAVEQFAQEEGAVADVDFGVGEVIELEGGAAAVAARFRSRLSGVICISPRAPALEVWSLNFDSE